MTKEIRYFQNYLSSIKNLSNSTIENYTRDILQLEKYLNNRNILLKDAKVEDILDYFTSLSIKASSFNRKMTSVREFYKYLMSERINLEIKVDKLHHAKNVKTYPKIIKKEDISKMISIQEDNIYGKRNKSIILMLYITGLRVSELCNLTYSDINFKDGYLRVIGKGNKEKIIVCGDLLTVALSEYTHQIRNQFLNGLTSNFVYVNSEGEPLSRKHIYNIVKDAAKKAGIKLNVTPHTLRHCFATHMLENGADIRSVQEMLGHSDISTTQIYLNISNKTIKDSYYSKFKDPLKED